MVSETTITFRCSQDLKEQLERVASAAGVKTSKLIREIIENYMEGKK